MKNFSEIVTGKWKAVKHLYPFHTEHFFPESLFRKSEVTTHVSRLLLKWTLLWGHVTNLLK